jgi:hypothetical protein
MLEAIKHESGKRFSTHYEGHAVATDDFQTAMDNIRQLGGSMDKLWEQIRGGNTDDVVIRYAKSEAFWAAYFLLRTVAQLEKMQGGVVHESKKDTPTPRLLDIRPSDEGRTE